MRKSECGIVLSLELGVWSLGTGEPRTRSISFVFVGLDIERSGSIRSAGVPAVIHVQDVAVELEGNVGNAELAVADKFACVVAFEQLAFLIEEADTVGEFFGRVVPPVERILRNIAVNYDKIHVYGVAAEGEEQPPRFAFAVDKIKAFAKVEGLFEGVGIIDFQRVAAHIVKISVFEEAIEVKAAVHSAAFAEVSEFVCGIVFQKYGGERNVAAAVKSAFVQRIFSVGRYLFCEFEVFLFYVAEPCFGGLLFKVHKYIICGALAGFCGENFCAFIKGYFRRSDFIAFG